LVIILFILEENMGILRIYYRTSILYFISMMWISISVAMIIICSISRRVLQELSILSVVMELREDPSLLLLKHCLE